LFEKSITAIIPAFAFHKMMYKTEIIERIASVAGTSPYPTTRIHALSLFKKLIEHASVRKMRGKAKANIDFGFF
jgi:hypothetical protein